MVEDNKRTEDEAQPKRRARAKATEPEVSFTDEELEAMTDEERATATAQLAQQEAKTEGTKTTRARKADRGTEEDRLERGRQAAETPTIAAVEAAARPQVSPETEETSVNALLKKQSDRVALSNEQQELEEAKTDEERAAEAEARMAKTQMEEDLDELKAKSPNWDYDPRNPRRVNKPQQDLVR